MDKNIIDKLKKSIDLHEFFKAQGYKILENGNKIKKFLTPSALKITAYRAAYFTPEDNYTKPKSVIDYYIDEHNLSISEAIVEAKKLANLSSFDEEIVAKKQKTIAKRVKKECAKSAVSFQKHLKYFETLKQNQPDFYSKSAQFWQARRINPPRIWSNSLVADSPKSVLFAHRNSQNDITGIFKRDTETTKKMLPGSSKSLFYSDNIFNKSIKNVVICEGQLSAIARSQMDIFHSIFYENTTAYIALAGNYNDQQKQELVKILAGKTSILSFDNDEKGHLFADELSNFLSAKGINVIADICPISCEIEGKKLNDWNDLLLFSDREIVKMQFKFWLYDNKTLPR